MTAQSPIIGIDLGTTNSVVAVMNACQPQIIRGPLGAASTPSVVGFTETGERLVGQSARNQLLANPRNTVFGIKRFIGRSASEVGEEGSRVPFELRGGPSNLVTIGVRGRSYSPSEISAIILADLKRQAEEHLLEPVSRAVITVPASFNSAQREATRLAGEIAGLKIERIISEPVAAALAYGYERRTNAKIAVFDLGGGTFNVSLLDVGDGVYQVLSTAGVPDVGGDALSDAVVRAWRQEVERSSGRPLILTKPEWYGVRDCLEVVKHHLSIAMSVDVPAPLSLRHRSDLALPTVCVSRDQFDDQIQEVLRKVTSACERALADAKLEPSDISEVVMVGGSTRIPKVQDLAKKIFQTDKLDKTVNPDEIVAIGAAIQAGVLAGDVKYVVLLDVTPLSLGVETLGGVMTTLIPRNTAIPTSKKEIFSTAQDNQNAVTIVVLEGESPSASDNRAIGWIDFFVTPGRSGESQIEVEFTIDSNGILTVRATDKSTGLAEERIIRDPHDHGLRVRNIRPDRQLRLCEDPSKVLDESA